MEGVSGVTIDPRVARSKAAALAAAQELFLRDGYAGTTMDDIADQAGITKRTLYNNYADKEALFLEVVHNAIDFAERFAGELRGSFLDDLLKGDVEANLTELAERMVRAILRPEVIALRRLLVAEASTFPALGEEYFDRAPGSVMEALGEDFRLLGKAGILQVEDGPTAAAQFAYLAVGPALDRAMIASVLPPEEDLVHAARAGVRTFLARYRR